MKLIKVAGWLLAITFLCSNCSKGEVTEEVKEDQEEQEEVKREKEIPIVAWFSMQAGRYATLEQYKRLREAGFTINFSHCNSVDDMEASLNLAESVGMKSIAMWSFADQSNNVELAVNRVKNHPALFAYFLKDEPVDADLEGIGALNQKIKSLDPEHPGYMNLAPMSVHASPEAYKKHIDLYFKHVQLPFLSFDKYPLYPDASGKIIYSPEYYHNLEVIRDKALEYNVPFWGFAQATAFRDRPAATREYLRFHVYSILCYGAQCVQYFTYWCPDHSYHDAPVGLNGERSYVYYLIKNLNKELQNWADVFMGCKVQSVYHVGDNIPEGTKELTALPAHFQSLDTHGQSALVSTLENEGKHYVIVMNSTPTETLNMDVRTDDKVVVLGNDGKTTAVNQSTGYTLTAGDICVFRITE